MKSIILSFIIFLLAFPCLAQRDEKPDKNDPNGWWVNIPSAPVIFDFKPIKNVLLESMYKRKYWFKLRNHSAKSISIYWLGCVIQEGNNFKVTKRFYGSSISDGGYGHNFTWSAFDASDPAKDEAIGKATCKDSKVTVVKVSFIDGTSWAVPYAKSFVQSLY